MSELAEWAKEQSPFLKMEAGESIVVKYVDYEFVADSFNPGKKKVQFTLELQNGSLKYFGSGSGKTAMFFGNIKKGDFVRISAMGEGLKRRYDFEKVMDQKGTVTEKEAKEIEESLAQ